MSLEKTQRREGDAGKRVGTRAWLLVFEAESSRVVNLPPDGELFIGRDPECEVVVTDDGVSRKHARLDVRSGRVWLTDLGSLNGSRLNGQKAGTDVPLSPGDAITISGCTLVLHCGAAPSRPVPLQALKSFQASLGAELERSLTHERPFTLACVRFSGPPPAPAAVEEALSSWAELWDVAAWSGEQLLVLMPEVAASEAAAAVDRLVEALDGLKGRARAGYAVFPRDGADPETLALAARQAVEAAKDGELESAEQCAREIAMGDRSPVLVADPSMRRIYDLLERLAKAPVPLPVLIRGETGSGKENAAFAVHFFSSRASGRFVSLNCGGLAESLLEGELFGFEKGAFSGAHAAKAGLLESASGGTVFLDEVGELSANAQSRLLRVLESKTLTRLGSVKETKVDIRVVAATHRDLAEAVKAGTFREDLFFRLNGATVVLPPLRERPLEIGLLARRFVEQTCKLAGREAPAISARAMAVLCEHGWPGNVRELKNALEYVVSTSADPVIEPWHLPTSIAGEVPAPVPSAAPAAPLPGPEKKFPSLAAELRDVEVRRIREALEATGGNQTRAAELIGMPRRTFVLRLRELRLSGG
ncbi:MAG: sigma 54-interacting transcriptional regulator [Myxococcaceae bacterium]